MIDEARIEAAVEKIEQLDEFIAQAMDQDDLEAFRGKWGDKISQVEPFKKGLYGDEWDEGKTLYDMTKDQRASGIDDAQIDSGLEQYFLETAEKFQQLAQMASTPAEAAAAEEVAETAMEAAEEVAASEGDPGEEITEEPVEEDLAWIDEEDPHEAMIASHFGG
ncbi:MAG: hypothetical protein LBK63_06885 [Treponema sp.]|jgi:hypothetical protein|nr:hypothetical protein [Treponema sp.]